ncbi:MAG: quinoprotein relay system zinc metallohydrolase 2 [Gammaproteobacteria bacterium]
MFDNHHNDNKPGISYRYIQIFLFSFFIITWNIATAGGDPEAFNLSELASGIYLHEGVHVPFDDPQHDDIANIGFIIGEKCVAVIDTGGSVRIAQALHAAIRKETNLPICYVINTHIHFDHVLGNLVFINEKPEFVGHAKLTDAIEANRSFFLEQYSDDLGANPSESSIIAPSITVHDTMALDLGGRVLLLIAYQVAHSHNDLTVMDQKTRTLWTGDLLFRERIPALDGSLKGWLTALDKLKPEEVKLVIPGHGPPSKLWPAAIAAEEKYLKLLLTETRKAIAKGLFIDEVIETVGRDEKMQWLLHDQHHGRNVSKAFVELEWE